MPSLTAQITEFVEGDSLAIKRTIDRSVSGFTTDVTLKLAWMTVKTSSSDTDAAALFQKVVDSTDSTGVGQIETIGTSAVDPVIRFDLNSTDTEAVGTIGRFYDIQIKTNANDIYTPERGQIWARSQVTAATA